MVRQALPSSGGAPWNLVRGSTGLYCDVLPCHSGTFQSGASAHQIPGCSAWRMAVDPSYLLHMQDSSRPGLTSLLDYHIHSKLCGHGVGELEEYVQYAVQSGLPEMGFSEHIFLYWLPEGERDPEAGDAGVRI